MKIQRGICTLCLENCGNFKVIVGKTRSILDTLLVKIDFTVIQEPVMCQNCEEILIKCFDFKTKCLQTQNYIVLFLDYKDDVKLDLKDVYLSTNVTGTCVPENQDVCVCCMGLVNNCSALSLDVEEGDIMLGKMIEQCLPELDLTIIKKPVICASCRGSLEDYFHFAMNCLVVGEKIKKHCETPNIKSKGQTELSSSLQLTKREVDGNCADKIKVEEEEDRKNLGDREIGNREDTVKLEQIFFDVNEDADTDVKIKDNDLMDMIDQEINNGHQFTPKNMLAHTGEDNKLGSIKIEETFCEENEAKHKHVEMEDQKCLCSAEIEIKTDEQDLNGFEDGTVLPQSEVTRRLHRRKKGSMLNLEGDQSNLYIEHTLTKKYVSNIKKSFKNHEGSNEHLPVHPSEVTMYKCDFCSFQTKRKNNLKRHLKLHKNPSEVTTYKCESCSFQTIYKISIKTHMLQHKDPSEVTMYKCDFCLHQTKVKSNLKMHLILHKNPSEVTMYICEYCSFQTKHKNNLKGHLLTHKDPSDVTMYKCDYCSFQTKRKYDLKRHFLLHKDPSEVTMYKCDSCSFQAKNNYHLKIHLLTHKDPSEVKMHRCGSCPFQTKYKRSIKRHEWTHRNRLVRFE